MSQRICAICKHAYYGECRDHDCDDAQKKDPCATTNPLLTRKSASQKAHKNCITHTAKKQASAIDRACPDCGGDLRDNRSNCGLQKEELPRCIETAPIVKSHDSDITKSQGGQSITNADLIRNMTDGELAFAIDFPCEFYGGISPMGCDGSCDECKKKWLKEDAYGPDLHKRVPGVYRLHAVPDESGQGCHE